MEWLSTTSMLLVHFAVKDVFWRRLRESHPDTYQAIGSPSRFGAPMREAEYDWAAARFLFKREFRHLGDRKLERIGNLLLALTTLFAASILGTLFL